MNIRCFVWQLYMSLRISSIFLYFLILIPTVPCITALFFTMRKLADEISILVAKTYFRSYKENLWETVKYWLIQLAIFIILLVDFLFVLDKGYTLLAIVI